MVIKCKKAYVTVALYSAVIIGIIGYLAHGYLVQARQERANSLFSLLMFEKGRIIRKYNMKLPLFVTSRSHINRDAFWECEINLGVLQNIFGPPNKIAKDQSQDTLKFKATSRPWLFYWNRIECRALGGTESKGLLTILRNQEMISSESYLSDEIMFMGEASSKSKLSTNPEKKQ